MWLWASFFVIALAIACEVAFRRYVTPRICDIFENVPPFSVVTETPGKSAELLSIVTADGVTLKGSLMNGDLPDAKGLVLFLPELRGNHWLAKRYCAALIEQGYMVLSVDFRGQGDSEGFPGYSPIHWITEFEMSDVDSMMQFINSRSELNHLPLFVYGVSRGAVAAIVATCRYSKIQGVVADSAFGTMSMTEYFVGRFVSYVIPAWVYALLPVWHVRLTLWNAIKLSEQRRHCRYVHLEQERNFLNSAKVLLISGERDSYVTPEITMRLQSIVGEKCQLWITPGAKHNMSRSTLPGEYDRRVVDHFCTCLQDEQEIDLESVDCKAAVASEAWVSMEITGR